MESLLLIAASLISIVSSEMLIRSYLKARARQLACKGVAGVAMGFYAIALALLAYGYFRGWGLDGDFSMASATFKTAYFLQHLVPGLLAIVVLMHLSYAIQSLIATAVLTIASFLLAVTIARARVDLGEVAFSSFNSAIAEPLPQALAVALLVAGVVFATALYLYAYLRREKTVAYLAVALGVLVLALAVLAEDFGLAEPLFVSALKLVSAVAMSYGLLSIKSHTGPLC
ncbi:MAG: hypothetical protein QXS85_04520 [Acidilobaceae archaeon]